jgi:hypothetical protein
MSPTAGVTPPVDANGLPICVNRKLASEYASHVPKACPTMAAMGLLPSV